jgi:hypothetical protein
MISITGDVATGKKVLQAAAKSVKRTHLELGGKAPVIVFDDADVDAVVNGLRAFGYYNAGQDCTAACRIYAGPKDLRQAGGRAQRGRIDHQVQPAGRHPERDRPADFEAPARSRRELRRAGVGTAAHQDHHRRQRPGDKGFYYEPTIVAGALAGRRDRAARGVRAGGLGHPLHRPDDAIAWANDSDYGLASSVWTRTSTRGCRRPPGCNMAAPGSTPTSCWSTRCRMAGSSSPATARTCRVRARGLHRRAPCDGRRSGVPASEVSRMSMSSGTSPRKGTPSRSASLRAPPWPKMS